MNKYILPSVIVIGLVVIVGYSQISKNGGKSETTTTVSANTSTTQQNSNTPLSPTSTASVPMPTSEDTIRTFFNLINEKRITEAISMMTDELVGDDSSKQSWGVQFNNINSITLKTIEPTMQETWSEKIQEYKVNLDVKMNPESANAPIPYYGWDNGTNLRWVIIQKDNSLWKISSISTGP